MGGHSGYASWFLWAYVGTFVVFTVLALWWIVDVVRRPSDRFPGSWLVPKVRWGLVPAAWLVVIGAQLLAWAGGQAFRSPAAAQKLVSAAQLGLVTLVLLPAVLVVGIGYLLRVVFPNRGDVEVGPDDGSVDRLEGGLSETPEGPSAEERDGA